MQLIHPLNEITWWKFFNPISLFTLFIRVQIHELLRKGVSVCTTVCLRSVSMKNYKTGVIYNVNRSIKHRWTTLIVDIWCHVLHFIFWPDQFTSLVLCNLKRKSHNYFWSYENITYKMKLNEQYVHIYNKKKNLIRILVITRRFI